MPDQPDQPEQPEQPEQPDAGGVVVPMPQDSPTLARRLLAAGQVVIVCKPNPAYRPGNGERELLHIPNWHSLSADDARTLFEMTYAPGDTLALVCGRGIDVLDIDTKIAGVGVEDVPPMIDKSFGVTVTPSGGYHIPVRSTGYGKGRLSFNGKVVGDYLGGTRGGGGRGLCYLPGSQRPKYPGGGYIEAAPWDIDKLLDGEPDAMLVTCLAAAGLSDSGTPGRGAADRHEMERFLADCSAQTACDYGAAALTGSLTGEGLLDAGFKPGDPSDGYHQWLIRSACRVVELMKSGCLGTGALTALRTQAQSLAARHPQPNRWSRGEYENAVEWAVANTTGASGCKTHDPAARAAAPAATGAPPQFWRSRGWLGAVHGMAAHRHVSPWGMAVVFLARYAATLDPAWRLPGGGSLNLYAALYGNPGSGKSTCLEAVEGLKPLDLVRTAGLGTGEGLAAQYGEWDSKAKAWVQEEVSVLFVADEAATMQAVSARNGSTLVGLLNTGFTGAALSMAYRTTRFHIPAHKYRLCLVVGVQPGAAGALFDHRAVGLSQRFLWASMAVSWDGEAPPDPKWSVPPRGPSGPVRYEPGIAAEVEQWRRRLSEEAVSPEAADNAHRIYLKCKVAALVALLEGRNTVSQEDWGIAEQFLLHSESVVALADARAREEAERQARARGRLQAIAAKAGDAERGHTPEAVAERVLRHMERLHSDGGGCNRRHLNCSMAKADREHLGEAVELLVERGALVETMPPRPKGGRPGGRLHLPGGTAG